MQPIHSLRCRKFLATISRTKLSKIKALRAASGHKKTQLHPGYDVVFAWIQVSQDPPKFPFQGRDKIEFDLKSQKLRRAKRLFSSRPAVSCGANNLASYFCRSTSIFELFELFESLSRPLWSLAPALAPGFFSGAENLAFWAIWSTVNLEFFSSLSANPITRFRGFRSCFSAGPGP